ncbi:MAG TPA: trypsin-like peptidase domain-containing protein [Tepidiformaceae bacterium]|nr:trypsin-like peptidase domain-containing protein [Tepidiformaceae bacterium]
MTTTNTLAEVSEAMANAVEAAANSVVAVRARRRFPATGIIWSADGVIVTSDHVIEREDRIEVTLPSGETLPATIAGRDPGSDVAVLRIKKSGLTALARATEPARVGSFVLAVGRPGSEGPMASLGVVGAIGGPWRTFRGAEVEGYLRTDTTFYPGFSGGPLIDAEGRAIGLNSSRLGRGAGLTIPIAAVARIAGDLLSGGKVRRAYLGVSSQQARLPERLSALLGGQESGLLIVSVEPGSPADTAGFLIGDILVAFAGSSITETEDLQSLLGASLIGVETPARLLRGGEILDLPVTVGERA